MFAESEREKGEVCVFACASLTLTCFSHSALRCGCCLHAPHRLLAQLSENLSNMSCFITSGLSCIVIYLFDQFAAVNVGWRSAGALRQLVSMIARHCTGFQICSFKRRIGRVRGKLKTFKSRNRSVSASNLNSYFFSRRNGFMFGTDDDVFCKSWVQNPKTQRCLNAKQGSTLSKLHSNFHSNSSYPTSY